MFIYLFCFFFNIKSILCRLKISWKKDARINNKRVIRFFQKSQVVCTFQIIGATVLFLFFDHYRRGLQFFVNFGHSFFVLCCTRRFFFVSLHVSLKIALSNGFVVAHNTHELWILVTFNSLMKCSSRIRAVFFRT